MMNHRCPALLAPAALLLLTLPLAGCTAAHARARAHTQASQCRAPRKAVLPHTAGTLYRDDNGARVCLEAGQEIAVFLSAPADDANARWRPITAQPSAAVRLGSSSVMTLARGTTAGLFVPTKATQIELSSNQGTGAAWHATLVVR